MQAWNYRKHKISQDPGTQEDLALDPIEPWSQ